MIPLLGAFAAGFIVIFPGLCLLEVALQRKEQMRSHSKEDEEAERRQASVQTDENAPAVVVVITSKSSWRNTALVGSALSLLIFGAFMLGIIVTNSFMNLNSKPPLCV